MSAEGFVEVNAEPEALFVCVQCNVKYKESQNAEGACSFHVGPEGDCCGQKVPCKNMKHRPKHHNEYPYGNFFALTSGIFGYSDTRTEFLGIEEDSMDGGEKQVASVGKLNRWKSRSAHVPDDILYVRVGRLWFTNKNYFFETFKMDELKSLPKPTKAPYRSLIYRTQAGDAEYAMAEWQFSPSGELTGVVISCKARSNEEPTSKMVGVTLNPLAAGEVTVLSEGSFREFGPDGGIDRYAEAVKRLNENQPKPKAGDKPRAIRTFQPTGELPAILWTRAPVACTDSRRDGEGKGNDYFSAEVSLYNISQEPFLLTHVKVDYRFIGEQEYRPVNRLQFNREPGFVPSACGPLQQIPLSMTFAIPAEGPPNAHAPRGRSLCARRAPIRVRISANDLAGATVSMVQEFMNSPPDYETAKAADNLFVYADNVVTEERAALHCTAKIASDELTVYVGSNYVKGDELRKLAGTACNQKITEIPITGLSSNYSDYKYHCTGLVDRSCQRIWAIKVDLERTDCDSKSSGVMLLPLYGRTTPTRSVAIAEAKTQEAVAAEEPKVNIKVGSPNSDDNFDDVPAQYTRQMRTPPPSPLEQVQRSLASIEQSLRLIVETQQRK